MRLFELRLMSLYDLEFKRIWVQRSRYSLIITLFPRNQEGYKIITRKDIYHGFSDEVNFETLLEMIEQK
ncbi:MAG: hypothetical protein ABIP51_05170 [Bacteroidia bacterium]